MKLTINKWGNSQGIRIPRELLRQVKAAVGTEVNAEVIKGKIVLSPIKPTQEKSIHELVAGIDGNYKPEEVSWGRTEGGETW